MVLPSRHILCSIDSALNNARQQLFRMEFADIPGINSDMVQTEEMILFLLLEWFNEIMEQQPMNPMGTRGDEQVKSSREEIAL